MAEEHSSREERAGRAREKGAGIEEGDLSVGLPMHAERTPNPNSVKWVVGREVLSGGRCVGFAESPDTDVSPLAARLFEIEGVTGVFMGADFVTINKGEARSWPDLAEPIAAALRAWHDSGQPALGEGWTAAREQREGDVVVSRIRSIIEEEIRPYVEQDGGEVRFVDFSKGVVRVHMRGACDGCPGAPSTPKMGGAARRESQGGGASDGTARGGGNSRYGAHRPGRVPGCSGPG